LHYYAERKLNTELLFCYTCAQATFTLSTRRLWGSGWPGRPALSPTERCEKCQCFGSKRSFCQDRLGTNIRKTQKRRRFPQDIPYKNPTFVSATTATNDNDGGISGGGKLLLKFDTAVEVRGGHVGRFDATIKADSKAWLTVNGVNATFSATASGDVEVRKYLSFCAILY
jgi:hypothetical protein